MLDWRRASMKIEAFVLLGRSGGAFVVTPRERPALSLRFTHSDMRCVVHLKI